MKAWKIILFIVVILLYPFSALAVDTKYFSSFTYKQMSVMGSEYSFSPELRFDHGAKDLYFYQVTTGLRFHPQPWIELGFNLGFSNEKNQLGNWDPDSFIEFVFDPKIVINLTSLRNNKPVEVDAKQQNPHWYSRIIDVFSYFEFEVNDINPNDWQEMYLTGQFRPEVRLSRGSNELYLRDDIYYTFKHGQVYRNWLTFGLLHPLNDFSLDVRYIFESDRTRDITPNWNHAHVLATELTWDRR